MHHFYARVEYDILEQCNAFICYVVCSELKLFFFSTQCSFLEQNVFENGPEFKRQMKNL